MMTSGNSPFQKLLAGIIQPKVPNYHFVRTINFEGGHVGDDVRKFSFPKIARTTEIT